MHFDNVLNTMCKFSVQYHCNSKYTPLAQIIVALGFGILLSPWSYGLMIFLFYIVIQEIFYYIFTRHNKEYYNIFIRTGVIYAGILGFIIGRTLSCDCVLFD